MIISLEIIKTTPSLVVIVDADMYTEVLVDAELVDLQFDVVK